MHDRLAHIHPNGAQGRTTNVLWVKGYSLVWPKLMSHLECDVICRTSKVC